MLSRTSQPCKKMVCDFFCPSKETNIKYEENQIPFYFQLSVFSQTQVEAQQEHTAQTTGELSHAHPGGKAAAPGQPDLHAASHSSKSRPSTRSSRETEHPQPTFPLSSKAGPCALGHTKPCSHIFCPPPWGACCWQEISTADREGLDAGDKPLLCRISVSVKVSSLSPLWYTLEFQSLPPPCCGWN